MTQNPVTVTYSLEEVLGQIIQKLDRIDQKVDDKFESLQKDVVDIKVELVRLESELKGDIKALDAKVEGIGKRLDTQEFINRSVVVGFVLALAAGAVKLFFPSFPNN